MRWRPASGVGHDEFLRLRISKRHYNPDADPQCRL
jgi:hypothetical protein